MGGVELFEAEITGLLCMTNSDQCHTGFGNLTFVRLYLERCFREGRTTIWPRLHIIPKIAAILAADDGDTTKVLHYSLELLDLASSLPVASLLNKDPATQGNEDRRFQSDLITAAIYTDHLPF